MLKPILGFLGNPGLYPRVSNLILLTLGYSFWRSHVLPPKKIDLEEKRKTLHADILGPHTQDWWFFNRTKYWVDSKDRIYPDVIYTWRTVKFVNIDKRK